jgi:hypothetical protein
LTALRKIAVLAALAVASAGRPEDSAQLEARRVFAAYIAARNRHDPEAVTALTARNIRAFDAEGKPHPYDEKRLRDVLAWEGAMHARWKGQALGWDGSWLEVEASEENDLYETLQVDAVVQRDRLRVEQGQIVEWRGLGEHSTGRDETAALTEFKRWIESLPAQLRDGAVKDGRLLLNGESAQKDALLIRRWRQDEKR